MAEPTRSEPTGRSRKDECAEYRPQKGGEAETTRFGMEEGDDTDIPATGPATRDD